MISFPNCKINIGLNILRKRTDGFHDIETVFFPLDLCDILEIIPTEGESRGAVKLSVSGTEIDCLPQQNLCVRAYELLKADFTLPSVNIHLHKVIPSGAGLGGGSSDAAFTLKILSEKFELGLSEDDLCKYASKLGSDCAFFIKNRPVLAYGRGDYFRELTMQVFDFEIIVIHPGIHVSTAEAYNGAQPGLPGERLEDLIRLPPEKWNGKIVNDFELNIASKYPVISEIKSKLYSMGAVYASMSGSGSAVYGLFKGTVPTLSEQFPDMFLWKGRIPAFGPC
jgi:4-diphosphocytidyl-2-C-methyl-D-erythritol kinase